MRIQVDPERLAELSGRCLEVASGLADVENRCRLALDSLDWEVRQRAGVEGRAWAAMREARALSDRAEAMARFLRDAAERFAEADRQELHLVMWVMGRRPPLPPPPFLHVSVIGTGRIIDLLPPHLPVPRVVPLAGGGVVLGGLTIGGLAPVLPDFLERVWNWLRGNGWKTDKELSQPPTTPKSQPRETPQPSRPAPTTQPAPGTGSSRVMQRYGEPYSSGRYAGRPHPGVDIAGEEGEEIRPIGPGKVVKVQYDGEGYGYYLIIEHQLPDGRKIYSLYAHLQSKPPVQVGQEVNNDTVIGKMGHTGGGSGGITHLHLEVRTEKGYKPPPNESMSTYADLTQPDWQERWLDPATIPGVSRLWAPKESGRT